MTPTPRKEKADDKAPLKAALNAQRPAFTQAARLSLVVGLLMLAPSWFMFEVYGRVLDSRNLATLGWLLLLICGVYVVQEIIELARSRVLFSAATAFDEQVRERVFNVTFEASLRKVPGGTVQVFNDLRTLREFIPSAAVTSAMDLPAALLCLVLLYAISPWLGALATVGAILQVGLAYVTEKRTLPQLTEAGQASIEAQNYASATLRNAQVIESMGMLAEVHRRWESRQRRFLARQGDASDTAGVTATAAKLIQTMQSSLLLGAACWLSLYNALWGGPGMMIVASILGGRVLSPMAQLVAQWRSFVGARDAHSRLSGLLDKIQPTEAGMPLPAPKGQLSVEGVVAAAPGSTVPILKGISFALRPGEVLMVVGPSAAGKTTLARLLMGLWPAASGKVRLDGADVHAWHKSQLGQHLGYMPQGVELFDGTVAENIARFGKVDIGLVREAADLVGISELIEQLPEGFDTRIGDDGAVLSGGQRQRLGLARAVYGSPKFLVLDEPNSSLDEQGERDLLRLLMTLKTRGATVVAISHRTTLLPAADKLLVLNDGQAAAFGPRDEVMASLKKASEQARTPAPEQRAAPPRPKVLLPGSAA
jgi:ATP-binding cassette, subfamily C, bacterial exporter for protease/lipase